MENAEIHKLVKNLENYFFGYVAKQNYLESTSGLKILFRSSWNGKTTIIGLGARRNHSIGCSFTKPLDKIAKDIKKRLMPDYRDDFFEKLRDENIRQEKEQSELMKLKAIAQVSCGIVEDQKFYSRGSGTKYVRSDYANISQTYSGDYELTIRANFGEALKILNFLTCELQRRP